MFIYLRHTYLCIYIYIYIYIHVYIYYIYLYMYICIYLRHTYFLISYKESLNFPQRFCSSKYKELPR